MQISSPPKIRSVTLSRTQGCHMQNTMLCSSVVEECPHRKWLIEWSLFDRQRTAISDKKGVEAQAASPHLFGLHRPEIMRVLRTNDHQKNQLLNLRRFSY